MKYLKIFICAFFCSCGPQDWNNRAQYLPAPYRNSEELAKATIQNYILDVPPHIVFEPDSQTLRSVVLASKASVRGGWSYLVLGQNGVTPRREFSLDSKTRMLKMHVSRVGGTSSDRTFAFRRDSSSWYYYIEPSN